MFGFLFKVAFIAVLVVGVYGYISVKRGSMPKIPTSLSEIKSQVKLPEIPKVDPSQAGKMISDTLDAFVTHPGRNLGPVVLGVQVTNDSLGVIADTLLKLKPDQLQQIRSAVCQP